MAAIILFHSFLYSYNSSNSTSFPKWSIFPYQGFYKLRNQLKLNNFFSVNSKIFIPLLVHTDIFNILFTISCLFHIYMLQSKRDKLNLRKWICYTSIKCHYMILSQFGISQARFKYLEETQRSTKTTTKNKE